MEEVSKLKKKKATYEYVNTMFLSVLMIKRKQSLDPVITQQPCLHVQFIMKWFFIFLFPSTIAQHCHYGQFKIKRIRTDAAGPEIAEDSGVFC